MTYLGDMPTTTTPDSERHAVITVGEAIKLADLTRAQAAEQAYRETTLQIRDNDMMRGRTEDVRSYRRNRNRLYMLLAGFVMALVWPTVCTLLHMPAGKEWTTAISVTGDLSVTAYALWKRY